MELQEQRNRPLTAENGKTRLNSRIELGITKYVHTCACADVAIVHESAVLQVNNPVKQALELLEVELLHHEAPVTVVNADVLDVLLGAVELLAATRDM